MRSYILIFLFIMSYKAFSCTRPEISLGSFSPSMIDFNTGSSQSVSFSITHNAPTTNCLYFMVFDYGFGTTWTNRELLNGAASIPFNIFKASPTSVFNILRDQPDVTSINHIVYWPIFFSSAGSSTNTHNFVAELGAIPPASPSGTYIGSVTAKIIGTPFPTSGGSIYTWPSLAERSLTFRYSNELDLNLSLVNTGSAFDSLDMFQNMSFDKLQSGAQRQMDAVIETNVGYRLSVSSENNGQLRNSASGGLINYIFESGAPLTVNNLSASSTSPVEISDNVGPNHPVGGYRVPIRVTIDTLSGTELAGSYDDIVTFTIVAH